MGEIMLEELRKGQWVSSTARSTPQQVLLGQPAPHMGAGKKQLLMPERKEWRASDSRAGTTSNSFFHLLQSALEPQPLRPNFTKPKGYK